MVSRISIGFGLVVLGLVSGCGSPGLTSRQAKAPASATQAAVGQTTTTAGGVPTGDSVGGGNPSYVQTAGLNISDAIGRACGIPPRADGKGAGPNFDFDSAALAPDDRKLLGDIAKCVTEGALKGRALTLTGRADPRGEPEYNMTLGESRADTVRRYMQDLGVAREGLRATSRGELDATGTNEDGWAKDRRVDLDVAVASNP
jgi:peptidoglycan-associated lipoprotein